MAVSENTVPLSSCHRDCNWATKVGSSNNRSHQKGICQKSSEQRWLDSAVMDL